MTDANQGYNVDVGLKAAEAFSSAVFFGSRSRCLPRTSKAMPNSERKAKFPLPSARTSIPTMPSKISSPGAVDFCSPMSPARRYHGNQKDCGSGCQAQCSRFVSYLGRRCGARSESPFVCGLKRVRAHGLDYTYNPLRAELLKADRGKKWLYDSSRKSGTRGGT